jgi:hypothetical protein
MLKAQQKTHPRNSSNIVYSPIKQRIVVAIIDV